MLNNPLWRLSLVTPLSIRQKHFVVTSKFDTGTGVDTMAKETISTQWRILRDYSSRESFRIISI